MTALELPLAVGQRSIGVGDQSKVLSRGSHISDWRGHRQVSQQGDGFRLSTGWDESDRSVDAAQVVEGDAAAAEVTDGRRKNVARASGDPDPFTGIAGGQADRSSQPARRARGSVQRLSVTCGIEVGDGGEHRGIDGVAELLQPGDPGGSLVGGGGRHRAFDFSVGPAPHAPQAQQRAAREAKRAGTCGEPLDGYGSDGGGEISSCHRVHRSGLSA